MKGILGKKIGMTQVFTADGILVPVTVIEVEPNVVTQIKTTEKDGYEAIQVATHTVKEKNADYVLNVNDSLIKAERVDIENEEEASEETTEENTDDATNTATNEV